MTRTYIDRKTKEHHKRLTRFDDTSKFVTEGGPKIVEFDEATKATRSLHLENVQDPSIDVDDVLTIKIMELVNAAKETRKYIEDTNDHIIEQEQRVEELKKGHRVFESQVRKLVTTENGNDSD